MKYITKGEFFAAQSQVLDRVRNMDDSFFGEIDQSLSEQRLYSFECNSCGICGDVSVHDYVATLKKPISVLLVRNGEGLVGFLKDRFFGRETVEVSVDFVTFRGLPVYNKDTGTFACARESRTSDRMVAVCAPICPMCGESSLRESASSIFIDYEVPPF